MPCIRFLKSKGLQMSLLRAFALISSSMLIGYLLSIAAISLCESEMIAAKIVSSTLCLASFLLMACPAILMVTWLVDRFQRAGPDCILNRPPFHGE